MDPLDGRLDTREGRGWQRVGVKEGTRCFGRVDAAPDESLREERREMQTRERGGDFHSGRVDPASHSYDYNGC
jgi:hypothetical protein